MPPIDAAHAPAERHHERGASLISYVLLVAFIAIITVSSVRVFGANIDDGVVTLGAQLADDGDGLCSEEERIAWYDGWRDHIADRDDLITNDQWYGAANGENRVDWERGRMDLITVRNRMGC